MTLSAIGYPAVQAFTLYLCMDQNGRPQLDKTRIQRREREPKEAVAGRHAKPKLKPFDHEPGYISFKAGGDALSALIIRAKASLKMPTDFGKKTLTGFRYEQTRTNRLPRTLAEALRKASPSGSRTWLDDVLDISSTNDEKIREERTYLLVHESPTGQSPAAVVLSNAWAEAEVCIMLSEEDISDDLSQLQSIAAELEGKHPSSTRGYDPCVEWFPTREQATPALSDTMKRFSHMVFLGVSHKHLAEYLSASLIGPEPPQWKSVQVLYAPDDVGDIWKPQEFLQTLKKSRQAIAECLTDGAYLNPDFPD